MGCVERAKNGKGRIHHITKVKTQSNIEFLHDQPKLDLLKEDVEIPHKSPTLVHTSNV